MKKKVSDIVADFLAEKSVEYVFAISGGASLHLIHSIAKHSTLKFICCHHEQACAMAADSYSRVTNNIGVAIATSGPGATNLITGICGCFYDSVPMLAITGQVSTFRMAGNTGVRQIGFQETPIVDICKPIVKYCVQISDPKLVLYELDKAYQYATNGRKGPVLIDIPDNLQREVVDVSLCPRYIHESEFFDNKESKSFERNLQNIITSIKRSNRPILIIGWGVHLSKSEEFVVNFAERFGIPIISTWAASDLLTNSHPLYIGTFGTHGQRYANFAVQNSDLVIALGTRLDTKATGTPISSFARNAKKIIVDIDQSELNKFDSFGLKIDIKICDDLAIIKKLQLFEDVDSSRDDFIEWRNQIQSWKTRFDELEKHHRKTFNGFVNPYDYFEVLSKTVINGTNIIFDTGCCLAWGMQALKCNVKIRIFHDFNNTAMGWSLPASIGAYFASPASDLICIVGDGSLMMSLHELAVIEKHKIPVKIFLMNNSGYSMIQQTQEQWLDSEYFASSAEGGLAFPNYEHIAAAFDLEYIQIDSTDNLKLNIEKVINSNTACLCNLLVSPQARVIPLVKAGRPNEDMEPLLDRNEFMSEMIIPPLK